jgi:hypothetical protein
LLLSQYHDDGVYLHRSEFQCPEGHWFLFYHKATLTHRKEELTMEFQCPEGHWFLFYVVLFILKTESETEATTGFSAPKGIGFFSTTAKRPDVAYGAIQFQCPEGH